MTFVINALFLPSTTQKMKKYFSRIVLLLTLIFFHSVSTFAVTRFWVSAVAGNFNTAGNWSTTSGGAPVGGAPAVGDIAVFDGGGLGNCTFTANYIQTGGGIQILAGYTGTISTSTFNVTFGSAHFSQAGGTFTCGSGAIATVAAGNFTLSGGTFTSTTGTFNVLNNFTKSGGTFNHNNGTLRFNKNGTSTLTTNGMTLNNLTFTGAGVNTDYNIVNSDNWDIVGTLLFDGNSRMRVRNGRLNSQGNITVTNTYALVNTHTNTILLINGTGNQTFTGPHLTNLTGYLPTTQINKASGSLIFVNKICIEGNWIYNAGTLDYSTNSTSTICFIFSKNFTGISHALGNVEFNTTTVVSTFNMGTVALTVNGTLTLSGSTGQLQLVSSTIHAKGDVTITHTRTSTNTSTTIIEINGTGNQTLTGTSTAYQGRLPHTTINKASGTLTLKDHVTIEGTYTYTAGTFDHTSFSNTVYFIPAAGTQSITGADHGLGNVEFNSTASNVYTLLAALDLTVNGNLSFTGTNQFRLTNGNIHAKGNINITNTHNANNTHTTNILVNGIPDQTINSTVASGLGRLPNININKAAGTLLMSGVISTESNWTYTAGTVDPQTSTVVFFNAAKTIDGQGPSSTMAFYNATLGDASTRTLQGNVAVENVMALQTGRILLNANTLTLLNGATGALTFSTGAIISENTGNNSKVSWEIGSNTGAHIIPFENLLTFDIPFTFDLTSGDAGTVTISTYPTAGDNTPYPVTPQVVTNVDAFGGIDNSANTVNRFWQIDKTGPDPVADLTFTYGDNEWDASEPNDYNAQRYDDVTDIWQPATGGQTPNPLANQVIVPGVTNFSPWTLSTVSTPLNVEMMNYDIIASDKAVLISWGIFEESEITHYTIEKTNDFESINSIASVPVGNSLYQEKDENPSEGISYYRVVAHLFNGQSEAFSWKKAEFDANTFSTQVYPNPIQSGNLLTIPISEDMTGLHDLELIDLNGRVLHSQTIKFEGEFIQFAIPAFISQGCYILSGNRIKTRITVL